jgi:hypothetical protein
MTDKAHSGAADPAGEQDQDAAEQGQDLKREAGQERAGGAEEADAAGREAAGADADEEAAAEEGAEPDGDERLPERVQERINRRIAKAVRKQREAEERTTTLTRERDELKQRLEQAEKRLNDESVREVFALGVDPEYVTAPEVKTLKRETELREWRTFLRSKRAEGYRDGAGREMTQDQVLEMLDKVQDEVRRGRDSLCSCSGTGAAHSNSSGAIITLPLLLSVPIHPF